MYKQSLGTFIRNIEWILQKSIIFLGDLIYVIYFDTWPTALLFLSLRFKTLLLYPIQVQYIKLSVIITFLFPLYHTGSG